jgi:hypothetical protein
MYLPSMTGSKYQVELAQITTSQGSSDASMAFAMMSAKLISKGGHQHSEIVQMVMAQVLLKAALHLRSGVEKPKSPSERRYSNSIGKTLSNLCTRNL